MGSPVLLAGLAFAVCGLSGSGKTTLLATVIPRLVRRGLRVAVIKHSCHGFTIDKAGKDSDRLFRAGADVLLHGAGESALRSHGNSGDLAALAARFLEDHDLVLVEGHRGTPLPKVWLEHPADPTIPEGVEDVLFTLPWDSERAEPLLATVEHHLAAAWEASPLMAAITVCDRSDAGRARLLGLAEALSPLCEGVLAVAPCGVAGAVRDLPCLPECGQLPGRLSPLLTAMRWRPEASWLFALGPHYTETHSLARDLCSRRAPGRWTLSSARGHLLLLERQVRSRLEALASGARSGVHQRLDSGQLIAAG